MDIIEAFFKIDSTFPHIYSKLRVLWGTYECDSYIKSLIISDRPGRQGFNQDIMKAILTIANYSALTANKRESITNY